MKVQIGYMILYGVLSAVFYLVVPLVLFEVVANLNLMTFTDAFKTSIIVIGIIGVVVSMLRHLFPKDTVANRLIAFAATVYSGIYLVYMFGGFTPGVAFGTYAINIPAIPPLPSISVLLGLQLIAWLFFASSGIRALQYLVEAIEISKQKEYNVKVRRQFKLSKVFKVLGSILGLVIFGYFGSLVYSGLNLGFDIHDTFGFDHDDNSTPDPSDDTLSLTITFDVSNQGIYAIYGASIDVRFLTVTSANTSALPENTIIGESLDNAYSIFHSFTVTPNNDVTVVINPTYIVGFLTTDAVLAFQISFSTVYAGILITLNVSLSIPWTALI